MSFSTFEVGNDLHIKVNHIIRYNANMKKQLLIIILLGQLLYSATAEQVEYYLSISNAEEELLLLESQFSQMQSNFSQDGNASENKTYEMELISIRFKEYIQSHLSENEMDDVLKNYKNVIFLQFVSAKNDNTFDQNMTDTYIKTLKENPEAEARIKLVEEISREINNKDAMIQMFDELMKPLMENASGGDNIDEASMKKRREAYLKRMVESSKKETLFATREFSMEELDALLEVAKRPAISHETKAVFGATAYALHEFFLSMASRYDISKH